METKTRRDETSAPTATIQHSTTPIAAVHATHSLGDNDDDDELIRY